MNQDDRIDELLNDLDTALSVEPSPAVAAKVRARIAAEPARGWWGVVGQRGFVGQTFRSARYAVALVIAVAAAYFIWPGTTQEPVVQQVAAPPHLAVQPTAPQVAPPEAIVTPSVSPRTVASTARVAQPKPTTLAAADREPEVLISPSVRLALAQLDAAILAGHATLTAKTPASTDPDVIALTLITIDVVKIEPPVSTSGGGGTVR